MERYFDAGSPRSPVRRKIYQLSQQSNLLKSSIQREINLDVLAYDLAGCELIVLQLSATKKLAIKPNQ